MSATFLIDRLLHPGQPSPASKGNTTPGAQGASAFGTLFNSPNLGGRAGDLIFKGYGTKLSSPGPRVSTPPASPVASAAATVGAFKTPKVPTLAAQQPHRYSLRAIWGGVETLAGIRPPTAPAVTPGIQSGSAGSSSSIASLVSSPAARTDVVRAVDTKASRELNAMPVETHAEGLSGALLVSLAGLGAVLFLLSRR